jgi:hypothetical protein
MDLSTPIQEIALITDCAVECMTLRENSLVVGVSTGDIITYDIHKKEAGESKLMLKEISRKVKR